MSIICYSNTHYVIFLTIYPLPSNLAQNIHIIWIYDQINVFLDFKYCTSLLQILFGKLFSILGILWTFSFLHYLIHGNHSNTSCEEYPSYLEIFFRVMDSFNLLRGFFMFLIFVCKKNVWQKVRSSLNLSEGGLGELTEMQPMSPWWVALDLLRCYCFM